MTLLSVNCIKAGPGHSVLHARRYTRVLPDQQKTAEHVREEIQPRDRPARSSWDYLGAAAENMLFA